MTGTPTSFIHGRRVVGALPLEAFGKVIDEEKQKAEALLAAGVRRNGLYAAALERNLAAAAPQ